MKITCQNLSIGYNNTPLHKDINFSIEDGSYTCIIGENGVGKSTLIKTLLGLLPPISGKIIMNEGLKSRDIGYLPQHTQVQKDFPASVFEVVLSGCLNKLGLRPFYNRNEKSLAKNMLEKFGIDHLHKKSYSELSGGQQQRVLLARALCATNKALLLDEPTSGLDPIGTAEFYKLVKDLHQEGLSIIMVTHNLESLLNDTQYILSIKKEGIKSLTKEIYKEQRSYE